MSLVVTLRACAVAGSVALALMLGGCTVMATKAPPPPIGERLQLDLPVRDCSCTDAGLLPPDAGAPA